MKKAGNTCQPNPNNTDWITKTIIDCWIYTKTNLSCLTNNIKTNTNTLSKAVEMKDKVHQLLHLPVDKSTF